MKPEAGWLEVRSEGFSNRHSLKTSGILSSTPADRFWKISQKFIQNLFVVK